MSTAVQTMKAGDQSATQQGLGLRLSVTVVIEPDDNGTFHAFCPGLKGVHVDGKTEREALENAVHATKCYIASLIRHGDPLPIGPHFNAERTEDIHPIPPGALLRHVEVQWPFQNMSGNK